MNTFNYLDSITYLRNEYVPFKDATLSIASSPVLYGLAVYTVFNVKYNHKDNALYIFRLKEHYNRLCDSAKIILNLWSITSV